MRVSLSELTDNYYEVKWQLTKIWITLHTLLSIVSCCIKHYPLDAPKPHRWGQCIPKHILTFITTAAIRHFRENPEKNLIFVQ